jgi:hypothetical protein
MGVGGLVPSLPDAPGPTRQALDDLGLTPDWVFRSADMSECASS